MNGTTDVTIVGGGLAGLIAAVTAAEEGASVRLLEARRRPGGRATSTPGDYAANLGPHALYDFTELWAWLRERGLHAGARTPLNPHLVLRHRGTARRTPPRALWPALRLRRGEVPVDADLRTWATGRFGPDTAAALAGLAGPLTFDHDPGRLSAAFVVERARRVLLRASVAPRYVPGGWSVLVDGLVDHARALGVGIELGAGVDAAGLDDLRRRGPVVVAVEPGAARRLDLPAPAPDGRRVALLDVGLARGRDPYLVIDLDEAVFATRPSAIVKGIAPDGCSLVQLSGGLAPDEDRDAGLARLEAVLDLVSPTWRDRRRWDRRSVVKEATGAVDLPGTTWRDRPAVDQGDGLWLAGDWVAAPGHLGEVSCTSAVQAGRQAAAAAAAAGAAGVSASVAAGRPG